MENRFPSFGIGSRNQRTPGLIARKNPGRVRKKSLPIQQENRLPSCISFDEPFD